MPPNIYLPTPFNGGVNLLDDASAIRENEVRRAKNLVPLFNGRLRKRPAMRNMFTVPMQAVNGGIYPLAPIHLATLNFPSQYEYLTIYRDDLNGGTNLTTVVAAFAQEVAAPFATYDLKVNPQRRPAIVPFNRVMLILPGYPFDPGTGFGAKFQALPDPGDLSEFSAATWNGTGNSFVVAGGAPYRDRMVYFNCGIGYEDYTVWSDPYLPYTIGNSVLAANGRAVQIGSSVGDRIVAAVEVMLTAVGSPAQSALLILKEYSAFLCTGELDETGGGTNSLVVNRISFDCGCSSPETVVRTPYGTIWASWDDVWLMRDGQVPVRIGSKIRPALAQTAASHRWLWHAAYFDGFYRLAVASEGQGLNGHTDGSVVGVRPGEQWWLDLRQGAPADAESARWWGPQQYMAPREDDGTSVAGNSFMTVDTRLGPPQLLGIESYYSPDGGGLERLAVCDFNAVGVGYDTAGLVAFKDHVNSHIISELWTRDADFGDAAVRKIIRGVEVDAWVGEQMQLRAELLLDGGRETVTIDKTFSQKGFVLDVDPLDSSTYPLSVEVQAQVILPVSTARVIGRRCQLKMSDLIGYVVDADNTALPFINSGKRQATLTEGLYTTLRTFMDHVVAQMTAVGGTTFTHNVAGASPTAVIVTAAAGSFQFIFVNGDFSDAVTRSSRKLGALMGFNTSVNPAAAATNTAADGVPYKRCGGLEYGGVVMRASVIPRRPA